MDEETSSTPPPVDAERESDNIQGRVRALREKAEDLSATFEQVERELKDAAGDAPE
jgi:hypothetical protein